MPARRRRWRASPGAIEREVGVTVSVGLSYCKFLAKLASDLDKPRGFAVVAREEALALLAPLGVGRLWGVGKVARSSGSQRLGLQTIGDLQALDEAAAAARLGEDGRRLWRLARGIDDRRVTPDREAKSISSETTFEDDVADRAELTRVLLAHCERVAARLRKARARGGRRDAEIAHARLQAAHAQPLRPRADAAGAAALRRGAGAARGASRRASAIG